MNNSLISKILDIKSKYPQNKLNKVFKKNYKELFEEICSLTNNIATSENPSILERLYIIENNISNKNQLLCPVCNKNYRKFNGHKYSDVCSILCHNRSSLTKQKIKETRLKNHNGKYVDDAILAKKRQTCIQRYNEISYSKTNEFKQKVKTTKLINHGSETYNNVDKMKQTKLERYGSSSYVNKEKIRKTFNEKYNVNSPVQIKSVQKQQQATCLNKYGVKSFLQTDICKNQSKKMSYEKMLNNELDIPNFSYDDYLKTYGDTVLEFKCKKCNNVFSAIHHDGYHSKCPNCYPYVLSKSQLEVKDFLSQFINVEENNRKIIYPYELDIYIPEKKLAIEYDGIYWHSQIDDCNYHLNKTQLCEKCGIQLIHIFENEWLSKKEIVKSMLKDVLCIYDKTIYAKNCEVKEIDNSLSEKFQNENNINGATNSDLSLGLFYENELVSLISFKKYKISIGKWKIQKFCNKLNYNIINGIEKLLNYFEVNYKPTNLIVSIDRRWSNGKLYEQHGFKLRKISKPKCWYWKDIKTLESKNFKNSKHIFDCGNLIFKKDYTSV